MALMICLGSISIPVGVDASAIVRENHDSSTAAQAVSGGDALLVAQTSENDIETFGGIKAVTRPSKDAVMGFSFPTEVLEVFASGGDRVKKGTLLVKAKDEEAVIAIRLQKMRAENTTAVKAAQAAVDLAQIEFDAISELAGKDGGNRQEYDRARVNLLQRQIEKEAADLNLEEQKVQLERMEAQVERFRLEAPFDGLVDQITVDPGQAVKDSEPVVRVVEINPLWIEVPAPTDQTLRKGFKVGTPAWVVMDLPGEPRVVLGKIIEIGVVADSASGTRRVRVEVPNQKLIPAGIKAWVRFDKPNAKWSARLTKPEAKDTAERVGAKL